MARVLVVDGDASLRASLTGALADAGHEVETASTQVAGLAIARASRPQVVIADLDLDLIRTIRTDPTTGAPSMIVLTSAASEEHRVAAFEAGVDDYVVKPHSTRELMLRVRVLSRKRIENVPESLLAVGAMNIDRAARQVFVANERVELTRREFDVLVELAGSVGSVRTREALVAEIWGEVDHSGRIVDTTIKRLRKKIAGAGCSIRTVRGVGYRLIVEA